MKIAIEGRAVLVLGEPGLVADAIAAALDASGGTVLRAPMPERAREAAELARHAPWLLVNLSRGVGPDPLATTDDDELERFARTTRALAATARRVVNVISVAGVVPLRAAPDFSARQAGLAALTRALAMELAPEVAVNALAIGAVDGGPLAGRLETHAALRRPARPAEIADAALFLADPQNSYTTGHVMSVDGGWTAGYARNF